MMFAKRMFFELSSTLVYERRRLSDIVLDGVMQLPIWG